MNPQRLFVARCCIAIGTAAMVFAIRGDVAGPMSAAFHILANHLGQFTCMSPVMSPYASGDDVVDAAAVTSRSIPLSDRLSACVITDHL
jgi:hypothetical protein